MNTNMNENSKWDQHQNVNDVKPFNPKRPFTWNISEWNKIEIPIVILWFYGQSKSKFKSLKLIDIMRCLWTFALSLIVHLFWTLADNKISLTKVHLPTTTTTTTPNVIMLSCSHCTRLCCHSCILLQFLSIDGPIL